MFVPSVNGKEFVGIIPVAIFHTINCCVENVKIKFETSLLQVTNLSLIPGDE